MKSAGKLYNALSAYLDAYPTGDGTVTYFQQEALKSTQTVIAQNLERSTEDERDFAYYYHMFTSTGKTRLSIKLIELMSGTNGTPPKTIIAVPKIADIHRIHDEIKKFAPHLIPFVGKFYSEEKDQYKQIIITTNRSFENGTRSGTFDPKTTEILILDEVHETLSDLRRAATLAHKKAVKIGLTATPDYSAERKTSNYFQVAYDLPHEVAFQRKAVAPHRSIILKTSYSLDDIQLNEFHDFNSVQLEKTLGTLARHKQALEHYETYISPETGIPFMGQQALFNCLGIKDAQAMAKNANTHFKDRMPQGVKFCAAVWGTMPQQDYDDIMKAYADGKILTLAQVDLLTSSFNHPPLAIAYNMAPSKSARVVGQRGGRIGRLDPNNADKIGYVVEMVDTATHPEKYPLFYAEYLNGARFGDLGHQTQNYKPTSPSKTSATVTIDDDAEIMQFIKTRQEEVAEFKRSKIIADKILPSIRHHMNKQGIENGFELYKICEQKIIDASTASGSDNKTSYQKFMRILTNVTSAWNIKSGEITDEADVLSTFFGTTAEAIFGEPPVIKGYAQDCDYPYNKEFHRFFKRSMKAAGFHSLSSLHKSLVLSTITTSQLTGLSRGQESPIAYGQWTEPAQEIACLFNTSPEELFGVMDREKQPEYTPLDQEDEGDEWDYDRDNLVWARGDKEEQTITETLMYCKRDFNRNNLTVYNDGLDPPPEHPLDNFMAIADYGPEPPKTWEELYDLKKLQEAIDACWMKDASKKTLFNRYGLNLYANEVDIKDTSLISQSVDQVSKAFNVSGQTIRNHETRGLKSLIRSAKFMEIAKNVWLYNNPIPEHFIMLHEPETSLK